MDLTRQHLCSSSLILSRAGPLVSLLVHLSWPVSCTSLSGLVIVSSRGSWRSCKWFTYCLCSLFLLALHGRITFQMTMVILYPTVIQPLFNKLSPLPEGELKSRIEALAAKLQFPLKHLYEIDGSKRSSHSNAYFFGLPWVSRNLISCAILSFIDMCV